MTRIADMEEWKKIDSAYEVSSLGQIRSIDRVVFRNGRESRIKGRVLSPNVGKSGYLSVMMGGLGIRQYIHRLVAAAFLDSNIECNQVNHKNGIKSDNRAENLEWVTSSQNIRHSYDVLGRIPSWLGKRGAANKSSKSVVGKHITTGEIVTYGSCGEAGRNGFDFSEVAKCCNGKRKSHKSFVWAWGAMNGVVFGDEPQRMAA